MQKYLAIAVVLGLGLLAGESQALTLKLATVAPDGTSWMKQMREGARQVKERTEGRVQIKLYGGGVQGNDRKVLRKIRAGQLQGGVFTPTSLSDIYADLQIYSLPLVFDNLEEVEYVRARMDQQLIDGLEEAGFVSFGFAAGGFAVIMGNDPVRTLGDLKGRKVWILDNDPIILATMKTLGLSPVALPLTDVLTGLQTGLLDFVASPPVAALVLQWHTKVKYVTDFPILYTMGLMAVDKKVFNRISPEDQQIVREVMGGIYARFDQDNRSDNEQAAQALRDNGLVFVQPEQSEIVTWRQLLTETNRDLARQGLYSESLLDEMLSLVKEFREGEQQARSD